MKKLLTLSLVLMLAVAVLVGCKPGSNDNGNNDGSQNTEKRVPVYQGMSIQSALDTAYIGCTHGRMYAKNNNGNGNDNGNNGNHFGNHKNPGDYDGDHDEKNESVDESNPFPDNNANENIENEINSSLKVEGALHDIYYAASGEDIYIYIHIDNPDSFEIMSFTLNGKKYSSYMFEDGSDMETIILKYNVGEASGIVEYTIDAIKYVDGTEIKDVIIDGDQTVRAGVRTDGQVAANVSGLDIGTNSISFNANIIDIDGLVTYFNGALKAVLYDGLEIVAERDLTLGDNAVTFDGLNTHTLYQYAVVGYYDDLSGGGFGMNVLYKDALYTESVVLFDDILIWQDSIDFSLLWHEDHQGKSLTSLKLYKDGVVVKELDTGATSVNGLLSANSYSLVAEYQNGNKTETIYLDFATFEKGISGFNFSLEDTTHTSVSFNIVEVDEENVGEVTKIELIHKDGTVVADNVNVREFTNLLSGNNYTIKVTYTYNLNDGNGEKVITNEIKITTLAKTEPTITVENENVTSNSIKADYHVTDVDSTLIDYRVDLYKGSTLISADVEKIDFSSLDYYTNYTVKITYTYNLNDGKGVQTKTYDKLVKTLPYIDVIDCNIANTSAVSEGDTIYMQVTLDNPLNMTIESVVINGETYSVTGTSTANKIFVEIVYSGQFAGGDTHLKIDKINAKIDGNTYTVESKVQLSDNVFINGKLEVVSIEFVNENFEPIHYSLGDDRIFVLLTVDNPTGYHIDDINHSDFISSAPQEFIKIDDNHWYYEYFWNWEGGMDETTKISIASISYSNEYIEKTMTAYAMSGSIMLISNETPVYISTPEDLKKMSAMRYYVLTNDIDLSGMEWIGSSFKGVLEGNGYSIKNMSFVGTFSDKDAYLGLFSQASGVIQNLHIENATIIANQVGDAYYINAGFFVGMSNSTIHMNNCSVDMNSVLSVTSKGNGRSYAGGFIGYSNSWEPITPPILCSFTNCTNNGSVSSSDYAGGFVGDCITGAAFTDCVNNGNIVGSSCAGGFVGCGNDITISSCKNSGTIEGNGDSGGFVGAGSIIADNCINDGTISGTSVGGFIGFHNSATLLNCLNTGNIGSNTEFGNSFAGGFIGSGFFFGELAEFHIIVSNCVNTGSIISARSSGGLVGGTYELTTITNSYSENLYQQGINGEACTVDQLNLKSFYTDVLGWSEDVWDISNLDVENGNYPKLK